MVSIRGVILDYVKWKESSIIFRVYTEQFGLRSYIINSVFKKTPKYNPIFFSPLNILEMVVYTKSKSINHVKDLRGLLLFNQSNFSPLKLIASHFISELISRGVKENQQNEDLFSFLENHIYKIDQASEDTILEEIVIFILFYSRYLGYGLRSADQLNFFDKDKPALEENQVEFVNNLLNLNSGGKSLANIELIRIINRVLEFLQYHIEPYKYIKSFKVLSSYVSFPS